MVNLAILLITVAAVAYGSWRLSLHLHPMARCRACDGNGRNWRSNRDRWGACRKCGGSGKRRRIGAGKER